MMWNKRNPIRPDPAPGREIKTKPNRPPASSPARGQATIARSITIHGEVSGDEDLVIEGRVDGSVTLGRHAVTVGLEGKVKGNITGQTVTVEGRVEGDLNGEERVVLGRSARVEGDIRAPRVVVQDGAHFKGGVEMGERRRTERAVTTPREAVQERGSAAPGQPPASEGGAAAAKVSGNKE